jgi:hypothetical protein
MMKTTRKTTTTMMMMNEEEEVSDSSSELEESILIGLFNDGRIVGDFRTTRPGIDIGCGRFRFLLTRVRSFKDSTCYHRQDN